MSHERITIKLPERPRRLTRLRIKVSGGQERAEWVTYFYEGIGSNVAHVSFVPACRWFAGKEVGPLLRFTHNRTQREAPTSFHHKNVIAALLMRVPDYTCTTASKNRRRTGSIEPGDAETAHCRHTATSDVSLSIICKYQKAPHNVFCSISWTKKIFSEEHRTQMDNRTGQALLNTQLVEEVIDDFFRVQTVLDRPLNTFTEEDVRQTIEQLRTTLKALYSLSSETQREHIPSYDAVIGSLQNTIVELTFALGQLSSPENKASFYKHLLASQEYFAGVFVHDLSETSERLNVHIDSTQATLLTFSARPRSLLDFSSTILPRMYALIQSPGDTCSTEYEQAITHLQTVDELLEKQKSMLKVSQYFYDNKGATLHCQLSVILAYANELLRQLIHSLSTLQTQSRSKSKRTAQLREATRYCFTLFIHNIDDILLKTQELKMLQHQEHFQQRNTDTATSEKILYLRRPD